MLLNDKTRDWASYSEILLLGCNMRADRLIELVEAFCQGAASMALQVPEVMR